MTFRLVFDLRDAVPFEKSLLPRLCQHPRARHGGFTGKQPQYDCQDIYDSVLFACFACVRQSTPLSSSTNSAVQPETYTAGWLLFLVPKADTYTLVYEGMFDKTVKKELIVTEIR